MNYPSLYKLEWKLPLLKVFSLTYTRHFQCILSLQLYSDHASTNDRSELEMNMSIHGSHSLVIKGSRFRTPVEVPVFWTTFPLTMALP